MKRKFYISLLAFVFFSSTTLLPVSIHLCRMAGKVSPGMCKVCTMKMNTSHCNAKSDAVKFINEGSSSCCTNKLVDATVKDNYLSSKSAVNNYQSVKILPGFIFTEELIFNYNNFSFIDKDNSPPLFVSNELYLLNSVFLI